jgi:putative redox protein
MAVSIDIVYEGSLHCSCVHGPSGTTIATDAPLDNGGNGEAFSPTDLVATALGSCILTIMGLYANRTGLNLEGTKMTVVKEMATRPIRRIGSLKITIAYPEGIYLSDQHREKLAAAVESCPVKQSLHPDIEVTVEFIN